MRTFSKLRALCSYPEEIDRPSARRDAAAELGKTFHTAVELWVRTGDTSHFQHYQDPVYGWLRRMETAWDPPAGTETEIVLGLGERDGQPVYIPSRETEPDSHEYVALEPDPACPLLTAGRADLIVPPLPDVGAVWVDDIKTGSTYLGDPHKVRQILAQGIAATLRAGADAFIPGVYYAQLGLFDRGACEPIYRGSSEWAKAWEAVRESALMDSEPRPGGWCLGCWSRSRCKANPAREAA